tara:strand:- start:3421 stop:3648 length:228 start_codon:yes stop_codon:yes gene_type:complete
MFEPRCLFSLQDHTEKLEESTRKFDEMLYALGEKVEYNPLRWSSGAQSVLCTSKRPGKQKKLQMEPKKLAWYLPN